MSVNFKMLNVCDKSNFREQRTPYRGAKNIRPKKNKKLFNVDAIW